MSADLSDVRLVIFDIDGTIIDDRKRISSNLVRKVAELRRDRGIAFALASSRPPKSIEKVFDELGFLGSYVAFDGGILSVSNTDSKIEIPLNLVATDDFASIARILQLTLGIFTANDWFVTDQGYWTQREMRGMGISPTLVSWKQADDLLKGAGPPVFKVMARGESSRVSDLVDAANSSALCLANHYYSGRNTIFEIVSSKIDKFTMSLKLCEAHGIDPDQVLFFGDGINDLACILGFKHSVSVENAHKQLLKYSKYKAPSNNEDGVYTFLSESL